MSCRKAIIPVAGYGTRRLPITKSIEKCMLPLGNRPVVDYIVQDSIRAGVTDIYFVVSGGAEQLRRYYERDVELERHLIDSGKQALIETITPSVDVKFHYIEQDMQDGRYGTAVPVWLCRDYVEPDELFLVIMGDDVTYVTDGQSDIERLVDVAQPAILGVPLGADDDLSRYGVLARNEAGVLQGIVEKPQPGEAPSHMINVSTYVLPGHFMQYVDQAIRSGAGQSGEFYLTDPINAMAKSGTTLQVVEAHGTFLDTGTLESWTRANAWLLEQGSRHTQ